ncbi:MAG: hypothetical protein WC413_01795 [Candidatus Nanoarchaeia archaeon]
MYFIKKERIFVLVFMLLCLPFIYAADHSVQLSGGGDYTDLESCLVHINNSIGDTCSIMEQGIYTINKSWYNISGILKGVAEGAATYGIISIETSNVTIDFNGTIIVPANQTPTQWNIDNAIYCNKKNNAFNLTVKNVDLTAFNLTANIGYGFMSGNIVSVHACGGGGNDATEWGCHNVTLENIKADAYFYSGNNLKTINFSGALSKETGIGACMINFTSINSSGSIHFEDAQYMGQTYLANFNGTYIGFGGENNFIYNATTNESIWVSNICNIINSSTKKLSFGESCNINNVSAVNGLNVCIGGAGVNNNNVTNSIFICNLTTSTLFSLTDNNLFMNNYVNITDNNTLAITLIGNNNNIINNTFNGAGQTLYTINEAWTLNQSWYASNSSFKYGGTNYNSCVILANGAGDHEHITHDNMPMTDTDGTVNYALWLLTDGGNAVGCGAGAKVTAYTANDYPLTCDALHVAVPAITCDYNSSWLFLAEGDGLSYGINYTNISLEGATLISGYSSLTLNYVNTSYYVNNSAFYQTTFTILGTGLNNNITGNIFYNISNEGYAINSSSSNIWYNNFYGGGVAKGIGCYNNIGNFYDYKIPSSAIASGECGLVNITSPPASAGEIGVKTIQWTTQTSYQTINYIVEYILNNVRTRLTTTASTSYTWSPPATGNYIINIIPFDTNYNATHRNISIQIGELQQPSSGSSGGSGGSIVSQENTRSLEESSASFATSENELSFDLTQSEEKVSSFTLTNSQKESDIIRIELSDSLKGIIKLEASTIILKPGETKKISFTILPTEKTGEVKGIIIINGLNYGYRMPITLTINSKEAVAEITPEEIVLKEVNLRLIPYKYIIIGVICFVLFLIGIIFFFKKKKYFY